MSNFHADNMALVTLGLKKFAENEAKREVIRRLRRIAERMVDLDNLRTTAAEVAKQYIIDKKGK